MLRNFLSTFHKLPTSNKSMVYLMWIYGIGMIITNIFVNIYIFQINQSFLDVVIYNILFYTSTFVGFSGIWWYMSYKWNDIKNMYYIGYFLFIISFILLFVLSGDIKGVYIFSILYALWNGAFWNWVHSQELQNIKDKNRDFYSSSISAWLNIIDIITPLWIAVIFYLSKVLVIEGYTILFWFLPLVYLLSFIFIYRIDSYIPSSIDYKDLRNFFCMRKYKFGHLYFFIGWLKTGFKSVILAIISITLLKNEINVGILQWLLAFISSFVIVHFSFKRNSDNRFYYLTIIGIFSFINLIIFTLFFNITYFIIFSLISIFLDSMYRVSEHTYDLSLMDNIKTGESDFYPAMVLREVLLWWWRITALVLLFCISLYSWFAIENILKIGLTLMGITFLIKIVTIYWWEKYERDL